MASISGFLSDAGLKPFAGRYPDLFLRLDRPVTVRDRVVTTEPVAAAITDATGAFVFAEVAPTDEMIPQGRYTLIARWDANKEQDVITGLRVPPGDWELSDLVLASKTFVYPLLPFGFGPPPPTLTGGGYFDLETGLIWGPPVVGS